MDLERPIEKLLRAWASKRRKEAGDRFQLHPATRRLLQGEVLRQFGRAPAAAQPGLARFWRRLGWSLAAAAAVVILAALLLPPLHHPPPGAFLAKNDELRPAVSTEAPAAAPPAAVRNPAEPLDKMPPAEVPAAAIRAENLRMSEAGAKKELQDQSKAGLQNRADKDLLEQEAAKSAVPLNAPAGLAGAPAPAAVPAAPAATSLDASAAVAQSTRRLADNKAAAARYGLALDSVNRPVSPAAAPSRSRTFSNASEAAMPALAAGTFADSLGMAATSSWYFDSARSAGTTRAAGERFGSFGGGAGGSTVVAVPEAKAPAQTPVLVRFQVQQSGTALRVIDQDGSIYSGKLQETSTGSAAVANYARTAVKAADRSEPAANYFFTVSGTNRSLRQNVVFNGQVTPAQSELPLAKAKQQVSGTIGATQAAPQFVPLPSSRISGQATVGRKQFKVEAAPAPRP